MCGALRNTDAGTAATLSVALSVVGVLACGGIAVADAGGESAPAGVGLSADGNVSIASVHVPDRVVNGSRFVVGVELDNAGDRPEAVTLTYAVDGATAARRNYTVGPDGTTVTLSGVAPDSTGPLRHRIAVGDEVWTGTTTVVRPARFVVTTFGSSHPGAHQPADEPVDLVVTVKNEGGVEATRPVAVVVEGETLVERNVTLGPGEEWGLSRTVTPPPVEGRYGGMDVRLELGNRTVRGGIDLVSTPTETPTRTERSGEDGTRDGEDGTRDGEDATAGSRGSDAADRPTSVPKRTTGSGSDGAGAGRRTGTGTPAGTGDGGRDDPGSTAGANGPGFGLAGAVTAVASYAAVARYRRRRRR